MVHFACRLYLLCFYVNVQCAIFFTVSIVAQINIYIVELKKKTKKLGLKFYLGKPAPCRIFNGLITMVVGIFILFCPRQDSITILV